MKEAMTFRHTLSSGETAVLTLSGPPSTQDDMTDLREWMDFLAASLAKRVATPAAPQGAEGEG